MGSFVISGSAVIYILNPFSQIDRKRSIILGQITFSLCQSLTNAVDFVLISSIFWRCAVTLEISLFLYKGGAWRASVSLVKSGSFFFIRLPLVPLVDPGCMGIYPERGPFPKNLPFVKFRLSEIWPFLNFIFSQGCGGPNPPYGRSPVASLLALPAAVV